MLFVADMTTLKLLSKKGAKADLDDNTIMTLLYSAVKKDHEGVVKLLLKTDKANTDMEDVSGWPPLSYAVEGGM
jgi:ankyrin repeat protein